VKLPAILPMPLIYGIWQDSKGQSTGKERVRMFWLKRFPRCSGDMFEQNDQYGNFVDCMQCGFSKDVHDKLVDFDEVNVVPLPASVVPKYEVGKRCRFC
jgi:hypothetical protein